MNVRREDNSNRETMQYWKNPENNVVYEMYSAPNPDYNWSDAQPVYSLNTKLSNVKFAKQGKPELQKNVFLDRKFEAKVDDYIHDIKQGGRVKQAALHSVTNVGVEIVNVFGEVFGKLDRKYAGKNLAREIPVPNLVIEIDKVTKFTGLTRIGEMQLPSQKELTYTRQHFEANKFGLMFEISEESQLKNVHNVLQDSVQVASNKVEQRASYDVIDIAKTLTAQTAPVGWDVFTASTDHSTANPLDDLLISVSNIEGAGVGGKVDRVGLHLFTNAKYAANTNLRGVANTTPVDVTFEPGTSQLLGMDGVGKVLDNGVPQGTAFVTSVDVEPAIAYFQGPQRVGSKHNEITGSDEYFIIDYHLAALINNETGRQINAVSTPISF